MKSYTITVNGTAYASTVKDGCHMKHRKYKQICIWHTKGDRYSNGISIVEAFLCLSSSLLFKPQLPIMGPAHAVIAPTVNSSDDGMILSIFVH